MRLITYLQHNLGISRRSIVGYITKGMFFLNGKKIESYKQEIYDNDRLEMINDEGIREEFVIEIAKNKSDLKIIIFNKPKGYVVSKADLNNKIIYEILPKEFKNYYYIGRLDKDSHGLLLLTDNSEMVNKLSHPRSGIEKEYIVRIDNFLNQAEIDKCLDGLYDDGELLKFKSISKTNSYLYKIILIEGKNRHIRRVFNSLGFRVLDLQRVREGEFELGNLKIGEYRLLKITESI